MMVQLALGTAQFGKSYGMKDPVPSLKEIKRILKLAKKSGIEVIDTAPSYQCRNKSFEGFKIIQKTPYLGESYGLLQHDPDGDIQEVLNIKETGKTQKIGISIYTIPQLKNALKFPIDIIQIPLNIVDGRFLPYLSIFKERGIEIYVRSIFLQGALLMDNPPVKVPKLDVGTCLGYVLNQNIDYVIVGVNSETQLKELLKIKPVDVQNYNITDENIILPYNWSERNVSHV